MRRGLFGTAEAVPSHELFVRRLLGVAGRGGGGGGFDDGIGKLAHGLDEERDDFGVELSVAAALEFGEGFGGGAGFFVGAVAGEGVVGVGDGENARAERNFVPGNSVRIA